MGAMSNDIAKLAYLVGVYKSFQRAGGAVAWRLDAIKTCQHHLSSPELYAFLIFLLSVHEPLHFYMGSMRRWIDPGTNNNIFRVKEYTDLAEETVTRMDDSDHIQDVAPVEERLGGYIHRQDVPEKLV